jgi:hypothetical protein
MRTLSATAAVWLGISVMPSAARADTYYASPDGGGDGSTAESPFRIAEFWDVAAPGDTLLLLDGTYTGADSAIAPPEGLSGVEGQPITVRAQNDGKVLLDGGGAREAIHLSGNDWYVIEGMDACCSVPDDSFDVYLNSSSAVRFSRASHNVVRRVVAWDGGFGIHSGSEHNLLEDVAAFGMTRKLFSASQGGNFTTIRRAWGRWEGWDDIGPKMTYTLAYNNYDMTVENALATWSSESLPETYDLDCPDAEDSERCGDTYQGYAVDQPYGLFSRDGFYDDRSSRTKLLGSIAYLTETDRFQPGNLLAFSQIEALELRDVVSYAAPGAHDDRRTFQLGSVSGGGARGLVAENLLGIGGSEISVHADWDATNVEHVAESPAEGATFVMVPGICHRYQDRVLTDEPLWPWPMNARILAATTRAGRRPVDVTATMESLFGPIPDECKGAPGPDDGGGGGPSGGPRAVDDLAGAGVGPAAGDAPAGPDHAVGVACSIAVAPGAGRAPPLLLLLVALLLTGARRRRAR